MHKILENCENCEKNVVSMVKKKNFLLQFKYDFYVFWYVEIAS